MYILLYIDSTKISIFFLQIIRFKPGFETEPSSAAVASLSLPPKLLNQYKYMYISQYVLFKIVNFVNFII